MTGWKTPLELTLLGGIWGGSFLFMRIGAADFGPLALVEVRLALGALILFPFLWRDRARITGALRWRLAGIGIINSAIPFVLFAWGAERAPAGIGAICNALTVLFTALVGSLFFGERISLRQACGMLAGFVGVVVLASGKTAGEGVWLAALAGTAASLFYGVGVNLIRRHLTGDGDLSDSAVRGTVGLAAAGRAADREHGCRRRVDSGRRGVEPAPRGAQGARRLMGRRASATGCPCCRGGCSR